MYTLLIIVYVLVAASLVGLVLIQHGKGADAGAAFGSGASGTVFGARGSANFLSRTTAWLAAAFFVLSLTLAYFMHGRPGAGSVIDTNPVKPPVVVDAPAVPKTDATQAAPAPAPAQPAAPVTDAQPAAAAPAQPPPKDAAKPAPATPKVPQ